MALNWIKSIETVPIETLYLLERCQIEWIAEEGREADWSAVFQAHPDLAWYFAHKAPAKADWVRHVSAMPPSPDPLRLVEQRVLLSIEDWIVYAIDPDIYNEQPFNRWDERELTGMTDYAGKRVVDIGSGTGKQLFALAPLCAWAYAVEPVSRLRDYLKQKADRLGCSNVSVVDGLMEALPFEDSFADVVVAGHVFGDRVQAEYDEMLRVVKPGGMIILVPGNVDQDNEQHAFLMAHGFSFSVFEEPGDGPKRKYWLTVPFV